MLIGLLRLFLLFPRTLWELAGIKRTLKRSRRAFKRAMIKNGLPRELAEELAKEYAVLDDVLTLRAILKYARVGMKPEKHGDFNLHPPFFVPPEEA
ncbi:hypothetical protein [Palaeococcus ferrophilus]|uniref:hypothetical protein n=1 Tax=Palaeococcus ferrophilus TaxID=83868 RepID=UPI000A053266|nr:hypothetical protein [Palaeococcus ferrophilus]